MRVQGIFATVVNVRGKDDVTWRDVLVDTMRRQQILNNPLPLLIPPGRLIAYDDLEGVLKWNEVEGTVSRDNSIHVANGDYCLKLLTGAVAGNGARARRYFPCLSASKFRFMCHWHLWGGNAEGDYRKPRELRFFLRIADGSNIYEPQIRYLNYLNTVAQNKWQYLNAAAAWTDVPGGAQYLHCGVNDDAYPFDNFLLIDAEIAAGACNIKRLVSQNLDLTGLSLSSIVSASTHAPAIKATFEAYTDVNAAIAAYLDDIAIADGAHP